MSETFQHSYDDWFDQLEGMPSSLPASRVGLGFYARRLREGGHVGVAIWLSDEGRPVVKVGGGAAFMLATDAAEEDFSHDTLAWCMAVSEDAYNAWAGTGVWPSGTVLERPKPARAVKAKAEMEVVAAADAEPPATGAGVTVRLFQACDPEDSSLAFLALVSAPSRGKRVGFSVTIFSASRAEAEARAQAWIGSQREKAGRGGHRKSSSEQPQTEGASA